MDEPVRVSGTRVGWPESECDALIAASIAGWTPERIKRLVEKLHARRQAKSAALAARFKEAQTTSRGGMKTRNDLTLVEHDQPRANSGGDDMDEGPPTRIVREATAR